MKKILLALAMLFAQPCNGGGSDDVPFTHKEDIVRPVSYDPQPGDHELDDLIIESQQLLAEGH